MLKKILIVFLILLALTLAFGYRFYKSVFRLSFEQITVSLQDVPSECARLSDCVLLPGDILIRRYVTPVTEQFDETMNPYFTHAAFYLGKDELFEALGNYDIAENQIMITKMSTSDWLNENMENFVILRPVNYKGTLEEIQTRLKNVANDPEYVFGPLKEGRKTASCSDIILKYMEDNALIVKQPNEPSIITPDYLFWETVKDSNFRVVGYSIHQKSDK